MRLDIRTAGLLPLAAVTAGAVALAPTPAHATSGRVWTLGVMNRFIEDDANRWLYPHTITKYGNLFYLELYGLADSIAATAPTSNRGANDRLPLGALPGIDGSAYATSGSLTAVDLVPVQATAGGGTILSLTDDLFIGLHLSDYENPLVRAFVEGPLAARSGGSPSDYGWITARAPRAVSEANRKFDFFTAYKIPDVASLGLLLTYGSSKYRYNPNDNDPPIFPGGNDEQVRASDDVGTSEFRFLLSGGLELGDELAIDAAFGMGLHGITYLPNSRDNLLNGGNGIDLQGDVRAMIGVSEWWELVPALSFRSGSFFGEDLARFSDGLTYNNEAGREDVNRTEVRISWLNLDLGLAGHFKPTDSIDFWIAGGYQFVRAVSTYEHFFQEAPGASPPLVRDDPLEFSSDRLSADAFPYIRLAMEAKLFSWLDFRAGVVKYLRADTQIEEKQDDQENGNNRNNDFTQDFPFFDYFVGFAAHYDGFFLDLQLDPEWFRRGPNFLSGAQGNMFLNASLGYKF